MKATTLPISPDPPRPRAVRRSVESCRSLDQTQRYVQSEVAKWAKVVRETGAKVD